MLGLRTADAAWTAVTENDHARPFHLPVGAMTSGLAQRLADSVSSIFVYAICTVWFGVPVMSSDETHHLLRPAVVSPHGRTANLPARDPLVGQWVWKSHSVEGDQPTRPLRAVQSGISTAEQVADGKVPLGAIGGRYSARGTSTEW